MGFEVGDIVLIDDVGPEDGYYAFREKFKHIMCKVVYLEHVIHEEDYWTGWLEFLFENNPYNPRLRRINFFQVKLIKL